MALTTPTYMTSFNVELTNPVFVANNVYVRNDSSVQISLENKAYTEVQHTEGDYVNYQMYMFANQASFDAEAEALPYKDANAVNTWGFRMSEEAYTDMTVEQAIYTHFKTVVMTDHVLSDINLGLPALQTV